MALFALSQWCGGSLTSFLQLDIKQAAELLKLLHEVPCFFPANNPEQKIVWKDGNLSGVSEFIQPPRAERIPVVRKIQPQNEPNSESAKIKEEYRGPPIEVEGSTEYLRIILPSSSHPSYSDVLRLLREWNFLRDRSHRHWWWLRDASKVLDFLASHQEEFELDFDSEFTENFQKLTAGIQKAEIRTLAKETSGIF